MKKLKKLRLKNDQLKNVFAAKLTAEEMENVQGGSALGLAVCCIGAAAY